MDRIDGYLCRKAQNVWPTALVIERRPDAPGTRNPEPGTFLLTRSGAQPVELGATFSSAHTALLALMRATRANEKEPH